MNKIAVQSFDGFLPDPVAYREKLLSETFYDVRVAHEGETYKHVSVRPPAEIEPFLSEKIGRPAKVDLCLARVNFVGELPNNAIHTDESYAPYAYVLYLTRPEDCQGGTAFWRHKKFGWLGFPTDQEILRTGKSKTRICRMLREDMSNADAWEQIHFEPMAFNKLICYPCKQWHSRWPFSAFGNEKANARLINVGFFDVK